MERRNISYTFYNLGWGSGLDSEGMLSEEFGTLGLEMHFLDY